MHIGAPRIAWVGGALTIFPAIDYGRAVGYENRTEAILLLIMNDTADCYY